MFLAFPPFSGKFVFGYMMMAEKGIRSGYSETFGFDTMKVMKNTSLGLGLIVLCYLIYY